jgi:hypothetical protein
VQETASDIPFHARASRTETNVAPSQLTHVPTNVMSITTDIALELDAEPHRPSVEMPWADALTVPESPPSYASSFSPDVSISLNLECLCTQI